jgi:hypothetical protein
MKYSTNFSYLNTFSKLKFVIFVYIFSDIFPTKQEI